MVKLKDAGFDPETVFNEGRELGIDETEAQLREQIYEMAEAGMQPDEIEEMLFDPAPRRGKGRRGGKRRCSAKQWAKMPQICRRTGGARVRTARHPVMVYDPASGKYKTVAKKYYGSAKKRVKAEKTNLLLAGGAALTALYMKYSKRVTDLKAAGATIDGKPVDGIIKALMYDLKNKPTTPFMDRLEANATEIFAPLIGGIVAPYVVSMIPKVPKMAKDIVKKGSVLAMGYGAGNFVGTVLDDINKPAPQQRQQIKVVQPTGIQAVAPVNSYSYSTPGGYY